jgi:hypothetical protein
MEANRYGALPILPILEPDFVPLGQAGAVKHLLHVHHVFGSEFVGIYGVWVCGVFSGLDLSEGTTCSTFSETVSKEISYRRRLHLETLRNLRRGISYLWDQGILTLQGLRHAARILGGPTNYDKETAVLSQRALVLWAFRKAKETVKP